MNTIKEREVTVNRETAYHFQIVDLRTLVVGGNGSTPQLHVQSLQVVMTRHGLNQIIEHLGPDGVDVGLSFAQSNEEPGVDLIVRASRWLFTATVRVQVRLQPQSIGVVQLDLVPEKGWSPADLTAITIAHRQIAAKIRDRNEIVETGPRSYELDIQYLVNDALNEGDLPIQWGAMLSDVESTAEEITFHFTPVPGLLEAQSVSTG